MVTLKNIVYIVNILRIGSLHSAYIVIFALINVYVCCWYSGFWWVRVLLQNSDVRQMYLNAQSEWLNHISVSIYLLCGCICLSVHVNTLLIPTFNK